VTEFIHFLSAGPLTVTMDSKTAEFVRSKNGTIRTEELKDVSLGYVLDRILIPQLPGPGTWTYEIVGKTVMIERSPR